LQNVFEKHINGDLNIEFVDAMKVLVKMPVNASVHQPMATAQRGASVALEEKGKCGFPVFY
jgi:hypothetical protein